MMTGSTNGRRPERFSNEAPELDPQLLLDQALVGPFLDAGVLHHLREQPRRVREQCVAVLHDEAAGDHLGHALEHARLFVDGDDGHHQAVFGKMPPIAEHLVADFAGPRAVDENAPDRRLAGDSSARAIEVQHVAVFRQQDLGPGRASREHPLRNARVLRELPVLAVNRHEVTRPNQRQHQLDLFFAAVAGDVDVLDALVNHLGAAAREVVDHPADGLFVARNRARRQHDGVPGTELHAAVVVDGDSRERRGRLALRTGTEAEDVLGRIAGDVRVSNLYTGRNAQISEPLRDLRIPDHPATDERDLAVELGGQVHEQLHAIDARRKGRDDQAAVRRREDLFEGVDDVDLRSGEAAAIDVGAIRKEREHASRAELREARDVEMLAVERRLVDLEIARVDNHAFWGVDRQSDAIGDAVGDANELDLEGADRDPLRRSQRGQACGGQVDPVFDELGFDQRQRERRAEDRTIDMRQQVRNSADMVLVAMCEHQRRGAPFLLEVGQIRNDQIHAQEFGIREHDAGVHDDRCLAPGEREHVHAELAEAAEGHYFEHADTGTRTLAESVPGGTSSTRGAAMRLVRLLGAPE